ncbi:hypothetical protein WY02_16950 [Pseudonocardia sp. AL041005-10]|nr:hypothetical protein [Pseudonocardia sp. AL041005-10]ALE79844.1 hypothetical protein WY02_16950 [Pseudonocardia sp. AL041005-10]
MRQRQRGDGRGPSSSARNRPTALSRVSPSTVTTAASPAGTSASPSRLGHRTPQFSSSHGIAVNAVASTGVTSRAPARRPTTWRTSSVHDSGHTTAAAANAARFDAAGIEAPVLATTSETTSCQAAG